jgi:hypothetical protein
MSSFLSSIVQPAVVTGTAAFFTNDKISEYLERTLGQYVDVDDTEIEKSKTFSEFLNYLDIQQISPEKIRSIIIDEIDYTFTITNNQLKVKYKTIYSQDERIVNISPNCEILPDNNNDNENENKTKEVFLDLLQLLKSFTLRNITFTIDNDIFVNALQNFLLPVANLMSFYIINPVNLTITVNEPSERNIISEQVNANFKFFFKSFENIKILKISGLKLDNYDEIKNCIVSIKNLEEIILLNCRSIQPALTEDDCLIPANLNVKKISLIKTLTINSINIYNRNVEINFPKLTHLEISGVRGLTPEQPLAAPAPVEAEAEAAVLALQNFIGKHDSVSEIDITSSEINFENFIEILKLDKYKKISYYAKNKANLITAENNITLMKAFNSCSNLKEFNITIHPAAAPPAAAAVAADAAAVAADAAAVAADAAAVAAAAPDDAAAANQLKNDETFFLILFNLSIDSLDVFYDGKDSTFTIENWEKFLHAIGSNNFIKNLKIYDLFSSSLETEINDFISNNFKINEALVELELIGNNMLNNNLITNLDQQVKDLSNLKKLIINDNTKVTKYLNNINDITHLSINTATLDGNVEFLKIFDKEFQIFSVESQTNVKSIQKELCNNNLTVLEAFNIEH